MKVGKKAIVQYFLLYLLLIMHGAVVWVLKYSLSYTVLGILCVLSLFFIYNYRGNISEREILLGIVLACLFVFSGLWNGESLSHGFNFKTLIQIYLNFLVSYAIIAVDRKSALTRLLKLTYVFAIISLIGYLICNIGGVDFLKSILPSYRYGESSRTYFGKYLFSILWGRFEVDGYTRNIGIYYEPGVYEIVINSSIFIILYMRRYLNLEDKAITRMLVVYILTIITTKSTTGYLGLAVILGGSILQKKENSYRRKILSIVAIGIALLFCDFVGNGSSSLIAVNILQKFQGVQLAGDYNYTSGAARMIPVRAAMMSMKENPILGIGSSRVENYVESIFGATGGTGNALFGMIATKGLFTTVVLLYMFLNPIWKTRQSNTVFFVFTFMVVNVAFAQAQIAYPSFVFISLIYYALTMESSDFFENVQEWT